MPLSHDDLFTHLTAHFATKSLHPTQHYLTDTLLPSLNPSNPLPALKATALHRLLATDITASLEPNPTNTFPADILNADIPSRTLPGPIVVQLLDVEDVGRSRWSQVEAIESAERGETTKGREVIRVVPGEAGLADPESGGNGPHRVLLQDTTGRRVFGFEMASVEGLGLGTPLGVKLVLKDVLVARAVVMLEAESVSLLGGKVEALQRVWKEGRKERLIAGIEAANAG